MSYFFARIASLEVMKDVRACRGDDRPLSTRYDYHIIVDNSDGAHYCGVCEHWCSRIVVYSVYDSGSTLAHELCHSYQGYHVRSDAEQALYETTDGYLNDPKEIEAFIVEAMVSIRFLSRDIYYRILGNKHWVEQAQDIWHAMKYGHTRRLSRGLRRMLREYYEQQAQWLP